MCTRRVITSNRKAGNGQKGLCIYLLNDFGRPSLGHCQEICAPLMCICTENVSKPNHAESRKSCTLFAKRDW